MRVINTFTVIMLSIFFIAITAYALSYPSSAPAGEIVGGKFAMYFGNMLGKSCGSTGALSGFSSSGALQCVPITIAPPLAMEFAKSLDGTSTTDFIRGDNLYYKVTGLTANNHLSCVRSPNHPASHCSSLGDFTLLSSSPSPGWSYN